MINSGDGARDLSSLRVLRCGALEARGDLFEPYQVVDVDGVVVAPVASYLRDLQACGRPAATQRSYAMDLLRWFRFLRAVDVGWDQATRVEARDFCRWIQLAGKPGGPAPDVRYAAATAAHCETVLRSFYDFHLEAGTGPMVNPFPLARGRRGRPNAHRSPMEPFRAERTGRYRRRCRGGSRGRSRMRSSMSCSPGSGRTGTGHWWRSGCPPGPGLPNCWGPGGRMPIRVSS